MPLYYKYPVVQNEFKICSINGQNHIEKLSSSTEYYNLANQSLCLVSTQSCCEHVLAFVG